MPNKTPNNLANFFDYFQDKVDIFRAYKFDKLATKIRASNASYDFTNANKIYVANQVSVRECIPNILGEELEKTDFRNDPEVARESINKWVENNTHNMIKDLLPQGTIDKETNLVLVNAAYFKGIWENQFDPNNTKQEIFYITPSKQTIVDMMHLEGAFNHGKQNDSVQNRQPETIFPSQKYPSR